MYTRVAAWLLVLVQCQFIGVFTRSVEGGHRHRHHGDHYTDGHGHLLQPLYPLTDGVNRNSLEQELEPALLEGKLATKTLGVFHQVQIPTHFDDYDTHPRDGLVSVDELIDATGATANARLAFRASDINGTFGILLLNFRHI